MMSDDRGIADPSRLSGAEVEREHRRVMDAVVLGEMEPIRRRSGTYRPRELLDEIAIVLADTMRFGHETGEITVSDSILAQMAASIRDVRRLSAKPMPLGDLATSFANWLVARADRGSYGESVLAAHDAATGSPGESELGGELREFVTGYLDGSIDEDEFSRRLKKPRAGRGSRPLEDRRRAESGGELSIEETEATLGAMVARGDGSVDAVWKAFVCFASLPVSAVAPERLDSSDGDLLLFETVARGDAVEVDLVRQFSVLDGDQDYERMEQLHCTLSLACGLDDHELVWSDWDRAAWVAAVEASAAFTAIRDARVLGVEVYQEVV